MKNKIDKLTNILLKEFEEYTKVQFTKDCEEYLKKQFKLAYLTGQIEGLKRGLKKWVHTQRKESKYIEIK